MNKRTDEIIFIIFPSFGFNLSSLIVNIRRAGSTDNKKFTNGLLLLSTASASSS